MSYGTHYGPKSQSRGCFFCGAKPRTDEHIIPDWVDARRPMTRGWFNKHEDHRSGTVRFEAKTFDRSILRWTVKEVCGPCNNGWMSRLEVQVKGTLESLLASGRIFLPVSDVEALRRWAVKTHIMRTQLDREGFPYPDLHKDAVRNGGKLPEGWDMWIAPTIKPDVVAHHNWSADHQLLHAVGVAHVISLTAAGIRNKAVDLIKP